MRVRCSSENSKRRIAPTSASITLGRSLWPRKTLGSPGAREVPRKAQIDPGPALSLQDTALARCSVRLLLARTLLFEEWRWGENQAKHRRRLRHRTRTWPMPSAERFPGRIRRSNLAD